MGEKWTAVDIPDQEGGSRWSTGANSGLGLAATRELARAGAEVVLACRNTAKGDAAAAAIAAEIPGARVEVRALDLASLDSVREFAARFSAERGGLDILLNNAGVMAAPRRETADGFESQFGTNHLGALRPHRPAPGELEGARAPASSPSAAPPTNSAASASTTCRESAATGAGAPTARRSSPMCSSRSSSTGACAPPARRSRAWPPIPATRRPTCSTPPRPRRARDLPGRQPAPRPERRAGALPLLYAATRPNLDGGLFVGPDGFEEQRGYPRVTRPVKAGRDEQTARRLWTVSEELTGVELRVRLSGWAASVPLDVDEPTRKADGGDAAPRRRACPAPRRRCRAAASPPSRSPSATRCSTRR